MSRMLAPGSLAHQGKKFVIISTTWTGAPQEHQPELSFLGQGIQGANERVLVLTHADMAHANDFLRSTGRRRCGNIEKRCINGIGYNPRAARQVADSLLRVRSDADHSG